MIQPFGSWVWVRARSAIPTSLFVVLMGAGAHAGTINPALRGWIAEGPPERTARVWVLFKDHGFTDSESLQAALAAAQDRIGDAALARRARAHASRADLADLPVARDYRNAVAGYGVIRHESNWLNAVSADLPLGRLEEIAGLSFVADVRPVACGRAAGIGPERGPDGRLLERPDPAVAPSVSGKRFDDPYGNSRAQLEEIGVIPAHDAGYRGSRVVLMMLDTGYRKDHEAFALSRILGEHDFVFGDSQTQNEPVDDPTQHWHGTATWSTAGGYKPGSIIGPAYGATFLLAKTEDIRSETPVEEDNYVAALEWGDSLGVDVTSASLIYLTFDGGSGWTYPDLDGDTAPITRALDRAAARGILCVNAMGNYGPDPGSLGEPADADSIIACGAVDAADVIANFSSRGPTTDGRIKPEVVARGVDTWSADANGTDTYGPVSGTSLSTPLVGGACTLVLEAHPEWSAAQARNALMMTADRAGSPGNDYGHGRINVWSAIQSTPVVVPMPFSLVTPAQGESVPGLRPTFRWNRSSDPQGGALSYELWVDEEDGFPSPRIYGDLADTSFTLTDLLTPATVYRWRVIAEEPQGYRRLSREDRTFETPQAADVSDLPPAPKGWVLQASPNPWRSGTVLRWYAPGGDAPQDVRLTILDPAGRRLYRERLTVTGAGWNETHWDPRSADGAALPPGVYLALLETPGYTARTKIVFTR